MGCLPLQAQPSKTLTFCVSSDTSAVIDAYYEFLQVAYAELDYRLELKRLPIKRTYISVDEGTMDGMVITTHNAMKKHKNIIQVPYPLTTIEIVVFSRNKTFLVNGRESLKPYKLGILRGYILTEKLTAGLERQIVNNYDSLFSILMAGRVDVVLAMKRETQRFLKNKPKYKNIIALEPPFFSLPLYHCLNKKHEALVPIINPIIERLIKEKVLEKIYKPYEI